MQTKNLSDYVEKLKRVVFRRWKVMALTFVLVLIICASFQRSQPPIYQAEAKVQYQTPSDLAGGGDIGKLVEHLTSFMGGIGLGGDAIETQIELIRSHAVLRPVLTKLDIIKEDMSKRETHLLIRNFKKRDLKIEKMGNTNIFIIRVNAPDPVLASQLANTIAQTYQVEELRSKRRNGEAVKNFTLEQLEKTKKRILELQGLNQDLGEMVELQKRREVNQKGIKVIEDKFAEHMEELHLQKNNLLSTFIHTHPGIMDLDYQLRAMEGFIELKAPEQEVIPEGEIRYTIDLSLFLREEPTMESPVLLSLKPNSIVGVLKEEPNQDEEITWCYVTLPDSTHGWISKKYLREKIDVATLMSDQIDMDVPASLRPRANLALEKVKAQWEITNIDQRILIISNKLEALNIDPMDVNFLQGELKVNQDIYNTLRRKLSGVEISLGDVTSAVVILEDAIPIQTRINTRSYVHVPTAILLAFILSLIVGFTFESISSTIENPDEIERFTKLKVLTATPYFPSHLKNMYKISTDQNNITKKDRRLYSIYTEVYRHLMTSIGIQLNNPECALILVTSSVAQEGKTTTVTNLGVSYAESDQKTLIVSCNVRHPVIYKILGVKKEGGITDIVNNGINWREAVQKTKLEYLDVISAGNSAFNIPKILRSPLLEKLFKEARDEYQVIIVDSPPALLVTDSLILASRLDNILLVYSAGETSKNLLEKNIRQFGHAKANILGLVMNQKRQLRFSPKKYYYYYGQRYYYNYPSSDQA